MTGRSKAQHRAELLAARQALPQSVRDAEADLLGTHLAAEAAGAGTVCAYLPVGVEPGSPAMLDRLRQVGAEVLLPVVQPGPDRPLRWGHYGRNPLVAGRFGLLQPAQPWLPAEAVANADMVLVPALAVDVGGTRLGRGGGFYDRTLPLCRRGARLVAVVRDCELLDRLPAEAHDVRMTHALSPHRGLVALGESPGPQPGT